MFCHTLTCGLKKNQKNELTTLMLFYIGGILNFLGEYRREKRSETIICRPTRYSHCVKTLPRLLIIRQVIGYWLHPSLLAPKCPRRIVLYGHHSVWDRVVFSAKSHLSMKDSATKTTCRGENGESRRDKSPPAVHSVDSCCGSWLKSIRRWVPVDYRNEALQFLKLAGPMVRVCLDPVINRSQ